MGGTRDPQVLAELARGSCAPSCRRAPRALQSRFGAHHALLAGQILAKLDFLEETVAALSAETDRAIAPYQQQVALRALGDLEGARAQYDRALAIREAAPWP